MHRCSSGFLLTLAITFVVALTGCLGKSSSNPGNGGVQSVTLSPSSNLSIDTGGTLVFSATAKDALGRPILGTSIQFVVESGNPNASAPLSVASNGSACAGTWDPTATMCSPGTSGIAVVTAVTEGVSSTPTTVYVHQHVDSIQISQAETIPPQYDCFSQGQTWQYQGIAYSNNVDITNSVGPMSWSSSNAGVVTTTPLVPPNQPNVLNQVQTTAKSPGITQLFASVSGTTSSPYAYTTCLIQAIWLQIGGQGQAGNSVTVNNGGSVSITATAIDTLYKFTGVTLTSPPLTWSTTNPEVAAFSSTTSSSASNSATARANLGGATVFASCTPPTCNIGVLPSLPIYASDGLLPNGTTGYGTISIDVTSTSKVPTYTAWAATTDCKNQPGCSSAMFAVTPGTTPIGAIVGLPRTPNSMMFNHVSAARVYLGSDQGLMYVDVTASSPSVVQVSNASTPCNVSLCGKVLTISNDGKLVVVSDTVSSPHQVYIFNASSSTTAPIDLIIPGDTATAAAFSPDQLKLFILTDTGKMYVYSTVDALTFFSIATSVTDVKFSMDGSFAYVAGAPAATSVSGFANCDTPTTNVLSGVSTTANPLAIYPLPALQTDSIGNPTEVVLALDPPNIDMFGVNVTQPLPLLQPGQFLCNPPSVTLDINFPKTSFNLGQGNFTPIYSQLVADGTEVIIVARNIPAVLLFNVNNGTTTSIPLVGGSTPQPGQFSASASTDGSQVYIAACDQYPNNDPTQPCAAGSVHIVNTCAALSCNAPPTIGQGDFQQVPYVNINNNNNPNMCNSQGTNAPICLPNLIAIKPQ
ncbi:MAG TPA: hypothetical protein VF311_08775 [Terriglobales bacterium]